MLYAVVVRLRAERSTVLAIAPGEYAHALFFALLRASDERIAEQVHKPSQYKPFTLSLLQGRFGKEGGKFQVLAGESYSIRVTFLSPDLFAHFMDAVLKSQQGLVGLGGAAFHIVQVLVNSKDSPLCNFTTFADLLSGAPCQREVTLQFTSPTVFRSRGRRNVVFPEPALVFSSYLSKWRHFSPPQTNLDKHLATCFDTILVHKYQLRTRLLEFSRYREIGFEGKCTFELGADLTDDQVRALNALADFAFYAGTGAKTTMGMGQTRRLK